jgi:hypothetical protein
LIQSPDALAEGREADAVEDLDFSQMCELIGSGAVFRVDAADAAEGVGVALEDAGEVAVVPFVVDDLDDDSTLNLVGVHQVEEREAEADSLRE